MVQANGPYNGQISGPSAGLKKVRIDQIINGLDIIASADSEARSRRAFYPITTDGSSFSLVLSFISWEEREDFNRWMNRFMVAVSEGTAKNGIVTVRCPNRNFIRTGVPEGDLSYGEGVTDVGYKVNLSFVGAVDPTNADLTAKQQGASYYKGGANSAISKFFYPSGQQIKGAEAASDTTFGSTPDGADFTVNPTINKPHVLPGDA